MSHDLVLAGGRVVDPETGFDRVCDVGIDGGLVWTLTRNLALDVAVGTSLYGRAPDFFVRAGGSIRFGH